jgi:hypothetical protein
MLCSVGFDDYTAGRGKEIATSPLRGFLAMTRGEQATRRYAEPSFSWIMGTSRENRVAVGRGVGLGVKRGNTLGLEEQ